MTAGMEYSELAPAAGFSRLARRNNSLSSAGRQLVFGLLFAVSVGIACAFAAAGAWLILPFAGLEMGVLYWAFRSIERRAGDYERIVIDGDRIRIEIREAGRDHHHEMSRYWSQVAVSRGGARLALRSHGRELEIGRNLSDDQRLALARELGSELRSGTMATMPRARV